VELAAPSKLPRVWDDNSTFGDIMDDPEAMKIFAPILESYMKSSSLVSDSDASKDAISPAMLKRMMEYMPIRQLLSFAPGAIGKREIDELITKLNEMK
jgi:beta-glucosidase